MLKTALLFFFVWYTRVSVAEVDEYVHPHYTYSCMENRSIIIKGISDGGIVWVDNKTAECAKDEIEVKNQQALILKECTQHNDNRSEVTVRIWDKLHDGNQHPPFPKVSVNVIGGRGLHLFKLICDDIPDAGVERTAERQIHLKDEEKMTDQSFEVDNVKMTFRTNSDINSEELTTIYTGDAFYMFLKYNGESNYVVMPINCTALKGYNVDVSRYENAPDGSEKILLWNNSECLSEISKSQSLMEGFSFNDNFARAKMYGFHFSNSPYISIICEVTVCKSLTTPGCSKSKACPKTTNTNRRKRKTRSNTSILDVLYRNNMAPQMKQTEHHSIQRRSLKSADLKNVNLKVYKSVRVLDTKTDISGARELHSGSAIVYLMLFAMTLAI